MTVQVGGLASRGDEVTGVGEAVGERLTEVILAAALVFGARDAGRAIEGGRHLAREGADLSGRPRDGTLGGITAFGHEGDRADAEEITEENFHATDDTLGAACSPAHVRREKTNMPILGVRAFMAGVAVG